MTRKTPRCIVAFALALYGFGVTGNLSAETPKTLSCIKLETLIEANEEDFAAFRKRNKLDEGANAGEAVAVAAVFLVFGLIVSTWEPGAPDEFKRLQNKNRELRSQASRENCNVPPSTAPWKAVEEIFNPAFEPEPADKDFP